MSKYFDDPLNEGKINISVEVWLLIFANMDRLLQCSGNEFLESPKAFDLLHRLVQTGVHLFLHFCNALQDRCKKTDGRAVCHV
jgi:hypothetical protein